MKLRKRKKIDAQGKSGKGLGFNEIQEFLQKAGIVEGDSILVHSSLSKLGYVEGGASTVVNALKDYIGAEGNILMPSSSNSKLQLDFIQQNKRIDLDQMPSAMGAITECFRTSEGVIRSLHPTESVCVWGKNAAYLTEGHFNELTPYTSKSPFYRLTEKKGKILYIGVTLDNAGTSLHLLEDSVEFKFPIYCNEVFDVILVSSGKEFKVSTKVHNPVFSKKRKCDELIPFFIENGVCEEFSLGHAKCLLFDSKKMLDAMIEGYELYGITMYTPKGS